MCSFYCIWSIALNEDRVPIPHEELFPEKILYTVSVNTFTRPPGFT